MTKFIINYLTLLFLPLFVQGLAKHEGIKDVCGPTWLTRNSQENLLWSACTALDRIGLYPRCTEYIHTD